MAEANDDGAGTVRLDGQGNLTLKLPLTENGGHGMVVIQENVAHVLAAGLQYAVSLLDRIEDDSGSRQPQTNGNEIVLTSTGRAMVAQEP
jgi:hypothetical protein